MLPSGYRRAFEDAGGGVLAPWDRCLALFPRDDFEAVMRRLLDKVSDGEADDDVGRATHWLGDVWGRAIGDESVVHRGPMRRTEWSDVVCFAGLGPGEVTVDGRKVVGISQRRTRDAARFQCVAYERWDPEPLLTLMGIDASIEAVGVGMGRLSAVEDALIALFS